MAGLTSQGLVIKTRSEIYQNLLNKFKTRIDPNWDDVSNNLLNIFSNIIAEEASDVWGGVQGVYDAGRLSASSEYNLDSLATWIGISRKQAINSYANLEFKGLVGTSIPQGTLVNNANKDRYFTDSILTLTSDTFSEVNISISTVLPSTAYVVNIGGVVCSFTSPASPTQEGILSGLASQINLNVDSVVATVTSNVLNIDVVEVDSVLSLTTSSGLVINDISNIVKATNEVSGDKVSPSNTLTELPVPIGGVTSVTNKKDAVIGRVRETDSEFRARIYDSLYNTGGSTYNALLAAIKNIKDVKTVQIRYNSSSSVDANNLPAKSYQVIVNGGSDTDIANTIFDTAPLGVESYGSVEITITDLAGQPQIIKFSRPTQTYIHFRVSFYKNTEEILSSQISDTITQAIYDTALSYQLGEDINPQKFFGSIYSKVTGIGRLVIEVAKSTDQINTSTWTENLLSMSEIESPVFLKSLITVIEV